MSLQFQLKRCSMRTMETPTSKIPTEENRGVAIIKGILKEVAPIVYLHRDRAIIKLTACTLLGS
jgi:hypothetical protein